MHSQLMNKLQCQPNLKNGYCEIFFILLFVFKLFTSMPVTADLEEPVVEIFVVVVVLLEIVDGDT